MTFSIRPYLTSGNLQDKETLNQILVEKIYSFTLWHTKNMWLVLLIILNYSLAITSSSLMLGQCSDKGCSLEFKGFGTCIDTSASLNLPLLNQIVDPAATSVSTAPKNNDDLM